MKNKRIIAAVTAVLMAGSAFSAQLTVGAEDNSVSNITVNNINNKENTKESTINESQRPMFIKQDSQAQNDKNGNLNCQIDLEKYSNSDYTYFSFKKSNFRGSGTCNGRYASTYKNYCTWQSIQK